MSMVHVEIKFWLFPFRGFPPKQLWNKKTLFQKVLERRMKRNKYYNMTSSQLSPQAWESEASRGSDQREPKSQDVQTASEVQCTWSTRRPQPGAGHCGKPGHPRSGQGQFYDYVCGLRKPNLPRFRSSVCKWGSETKYCTQKWCLVSFNDDDDISCFRPSIQNQPVI